MSTLLNPIFHAQFDFAFYELLCRIVRNANSCKSSKSMQCSPPSFDGPTYVAQIKIHYLRFEESQASLGECYLGGEQPLLKKLQGYYYCLEATLSIAEAQAQLGATIDAATAYAAALQTDTGPLIDCSKGDHVDRVDLLDNLGNVVDMLSSVAGWGSSSRLALTPGAGKAIVADLLRDAREAPTYRAAKRLRYTADLLQAQLSAKQHGGRVAA